MYKSYTHNLSAVKILSYVFLLLKGEPIASFPSFDDCNQFVADFMRLSY